jgi:hypothetical protein
MWLSPPLLSALTSWIKGLLSSDLFWLLFAMFILQGFGVALGERSTLWKVGPEEAKLQSHRRSTLIPPSPDLELHRTLSS